MSKNMSGNTCETKVLKSPSIITIQKYEYERKVKTLTATKEIEKICIDELKRKMLNLNDYKNSEIMESKILKEVNIELISHPNAVEIKKNYNFQKEKINSKPNVLATKAMKNLILLQVFIALLSQNIFAQPILLRDDFDKDDGSWYLKNDAS